MTAEQITVYFNPNCSKCRKLKVLLASQDLAVKWVYYLENPLSKSDLTDLLLKMKARPSDIIRLSEQECQDKTDEDLLQLLVERPELLNRPIVEREDTAFLCRPVEIIAEKMPDYDWSEYL